MSKLLRTENMHMNNNHAVSTVVSSMLAIAIIMTGIRIFGTVLRPTTSWHIMQV